MRKLGLVLVLALSGCASYFTPRPPVFEDRLGIWGREKIGTLATAPDYRVIIVQLVPETKLCAEAPADAAGQFASTFAAAFSTPQQITAEGRAAMAVAIKQLFKRSQGVQFYRDGAFALCNAYLNGVLTKDEYAKELRELRIVVAELIKTEIPFLEKITIDPIQVPVAPKPEELKQPTLPVK